MNTEKRNVQSLTPSRRLKGQRYGSAESGEGWSITRLARGGKLENSLIEIPLLTAAHPEACRFAHYLSALAGRPRT
jgi:hypothetical protein